MGISTKFVIRRTEKDLFLGLSGFGIVGRERKRTVREREGERKRGRNKEKLRKEIERS